MLPGLALVLLVAAPGPLGRRISRLLVGGAALLLAGGWWFVVVGLIPKGSRPWVGGSGTGNPLDLALGYNGLGRVLGQKSPSGRITVKGGSPWRLLGSAGDQISWLIPAALIALVVCLVLTRRAGRTDPVRAAVLLWGGWAVVASLVLSVAQGIWHAYYTIELAPAYAALIAIGATLLWRRDTRRARATLAAGSALTTGWAVSLSTRHLPLINPVSIAVVVLGIAAVVLLMPAPARSPGPRERRAAVALVVLAAAVGPPLVPGHRGPPALGPFPGRRPGAGGAPGAAGQEAVPPATPEALALLRADAAAFTWTAAAVGHRADDLQLAVGTPVMPVGGFAGDDPSPTLAAFQAYVAAGRIHWFVAGSPGSHTAAAIDAWVRSSAPLVHAGKTTLYDLSSCVPRADDAGGSALGGRRQDDGHRQRTVPGRDPELGDPAGRGEVGTGGLDQGDAVRGSGHGRRLDVGPHRLLGVGLRLAHGGQHLGGRADDGGVAVGRQLGGNRPRGAVHRPGLPPGPDLLGDERQHGGKQPELHREGQRQGGVGGPGGRTSA